MKFAELQNKNIAILGVGVEGIATAEYFLSHNLQFSLIDSKTYVELCAVSPHWERVLGQCKEAGIPMHLGNEITADILSQFNVIVKSPGINQHNEYIKRLPRSIAITSQTKLFFDNCPARIIGVTGTKGKGTTASLIYEMLKKGGFDAYLGGNIGMPSLSFLDTLTTQSIAILELSSFQLQDMQKSPQIAVMLMVTSEHLDFHKDTKEYVDAKRNIVRFQTVDDMAILNTDYPATRESAEKTSARVAWVSRYQEVGDGCFIRDNQVILRTNRQETLVIDISDILLPGAHNLENICAATMAAYTAGVSIPDIAFVLKTFKGLEHRLELVREVNGARYYDDSFSTVPETAIAAISAFTSPEILILGGSSKHSDFTELGKTIRSVSNIKAIIGIGVEWEKIKESIKNQESRIEFVEGLTNMKDIVQRAHELATPGDVVLLSPACASFDMFKNYKDRGNQFKEQVNLL